MKWNRFTIKTKTEAEDVIISALADVGVEGVEIQDKQPLTETDKEQMFVDIMPEGPADDGIAYLNFYLEEDTETAPVLERVRAVLEEVRGYMDIGEGTITESQTEDKDWINNWKEYFHQFYVDDILIVPSWEEVKEEDKDKMILHIDPGTAFGTGMHETTQLVIRQLKKFVTKDTQMLDVGTGSGILGIVALKLGAAHVVGTDLDPCAIPAVADNKEANDIKDETFDMLIGNIIDDKEVQGRMGICHSQKGIIMQRFFVEPYQVLEEEHRITLTGPDLNHMKNVLRMRIGEDVWISDGSEKEYHCTIEEFQEDSAVLHILYAQESQYELPSRIYLFQGLPKGDKMELIIQKAVELGAYAVVPVETRRCVVKLDAKKAQKKVTRWQQISESAAKQSKRMLIPEVKNVMNWKEALAFAKGLDVVLIPYELAQGMKETREILAAIQPGQSVGIFIGPEGGFEEEEVGDAMEAGGKPVTLGKRILRTETAGMTMLSILMYTLESV